MKSFIDLVVFPKKFPGVRLVIDIETEDELRVLTALWSYNNTVANAISSSVYMTQSASDKAAFVLSQTFSPLQDETEKHLNQ